MQILIRNPHRLHRLVSHALPPDGPLHRRSERARREDHLRPRRTRLGAKTTLDDPIAESLNPEERERYVYPQVRVIPPGGPYFKWPWERVYKVTIATQTLNMAFDPEEPTANEGGSRLDAVTKDQLNTGLTGQIRYRVCEANLYAFSSA